MKRKEITKTFMMISISKKPFGFLGCIYFSALRVNGGLYHNDYSGSWRLKGQYSL